MPLAQIDDGTQQLVSTIFAAPLETVLAATLLILVLAALFQVVNQNRLTSALNRKVDQDAIQTHAIENIAMSISKIAETAAHGDASATQALAVIQKVNTKMDGQEDRQKLILRGLKIIYEQQTKLQARVDALAGNKSDIESLRRSMEALSNDLHQLVKAINPEKEKPDA